VVEASGGTGVDVVLDAVGGDIRAAALRALATFGRAAIYGGASGSQGIDTEALQRLSFSNQALIGFALPPVWQSRPRWASAAVDDMAKQLADGRLRVHTQTWPLSEAAAAHAAMEQRSTTGKVALLP
jgi:NADPH2:quinone reductase